MARWTRLLMPAGSESRVGAPLALQLLRVPISMIDARLPLTLRIVALAP